MPQGYRGTGRWSCSTAGRGRPSLLDVARRRGSLLLIAFLVAVMAGGGGGVSAPWVPRSADPTAVTVVAQVIPVGLVVSAYRIRME